MKTDFFEKNKGLLGVALAVVLLSMTVVGVYLLAPLQQRETEPPTEDEKQEQPQDTYPEMADGALLPTGGAKDDGVVMAPLTTTTKEPTTEGVPTHKTEVQPAPEHGGEQASEMTGQEDRAEAPQASIAISGSAGLSYRSYGNGNCILEGLGACEDVCVIIPSHSPEGDVVVAIDSGALRGSAVEAVQLPETVQSIGTGAFAGCERLVWFSVAAGNTAFRAVDGVLYSYDAATLLAYPAGRHGPTATIPAVVRYIAAGAFADCPSLQRVCYEGSVAQWQTVQIAQKNNCLYTLPMCFAGEE